MSNKNDSIDNRPSDISALINEAQKMIAVDEHAKKLERMVENNKKREYEERKVRAAEETAANTGMANRQLNEIIEYQKTQIEQLENQLATSKAQLDELHKLFVSSEDGVSVEKEIAGIIRKQIDETHPLWDYVKDKGGDIAVDAFVAGTPVLYNSFKIFLQSKGIVLP